MKRNRACAVSSKLHIGAVLAMAVGGISAWMSPSQAASVQLQDTNLTLTDPGAWSGGPPQATDTGVFGSSLIGAVNSTYTWAVGAGSSNTWLGIQVLSPGGNITINDSANFLALAAGGIDMSAATRNLTLSTAIELTAGQTWSIGTGTSLIVNGTIAMGTSGLTINASGNVNINGGLLGAAASLIKVGSGILTLSSQNTYTGGTTLGSTSSTGGVLALDFSGVGAPAVNILSASSALNSSNAVVNVIGNANFSVSQTINGTTVAFGLTTITSTSSGSGVTVNLGTITKTFNQGASVRIIPNANATLSTFFATNAANGTPNGLVQVANTQAAANAGSYMTYGLSDFAGVTAGQIGAVTYTNVTNGQAVTVSVIGAAYDVNGGSSSVTSGGIFIDAVRFSGAGAKTFTVTSGNLQLGGVLVAPSIGANDVTLAGTGIRTETNSDIVIWQNNTQGNLIINIPLATRGGTGSLVKNGLGTLIMSATNSQALNGNIYVNEGLIQFNSATGLGSTNGSAVVLEGGGISINATFADSNAANQHPIRIVGSGSINVLGTNTFTISGSSNTAITGAGLLTKTGPGTLVLANTASNWSGGFAINGGLVNVTATTGTPIGTGPISVNAGGTLTATGVIPSGFTVNSGGSWAVSSGTINGSVTLNPGASVTGTGTVTSPVVLSAGGGISPASQTTLGTLNFQSLTLASGTILNLTLQAVPKSSDQVNILSGGTISLGSGITVNMFNVTSGVSFFANGTYALLTGIDVIDAGKYVGGSATSGILTNFVAGNFNVSTGASAVFSIVNPGTSSTIIVTVSGASTAATWTGQGAAGNWQDDANWNPSAPGAVAGDIASLVGSVVPSTINLNGNVKLGTFAIDSGTNNTGYTIAAGSGPGKLFVNNGTIAATVTVVNGLQTISANVEVDSPAIITASSTIGSLLVTGVVSNSATNSPITIVGPGTVVFASDNTLASNGTISSNATLQLGNGGASGSWGTGTLTVSGVLAVSKTGVFNYTSLAGLITGTGTVTQAGPGQMIWNNTLTSGGFTGTLNVAGGTATLGAGSFFPLGLSVGAAATFDLAGNNTTISSLTSAGIITNASATPIVFNINNAAAGTLGGTITNGAGSLTIYKTGAGVLTMNGTSSYTGELDVHAGAVQLNSSTAAPAGTTIATDVASGLLVGDGVVVSANIVGNRGLQAAGNGWDLPTGSATFAGNVTVGTASQYRFRVESAGTLTATGLWDATQDTAAFGDVILMTSGNIVFSGPSAELKLGNTVEGLHGETFFIGRANGGTSNVTNVTFQNGATFVNTSSPSLMSLVNGGNTLGGAPGGSAIQLGATGGTNAAQSLTVDHSYVNIGLLNFELEGQASTSAVNVLGGTITAGSYTKTNNSAATTFTVDGGDLIATQSNANYLASSAATLLSLAIGPNGATIDTTASGFSLGIGAHIVTGTSGIAGILSVIGSGTITLGATGSTYNGATRLATTVLTGVADNVFSPNSPLLVYNTGAVIGGGFSQSVGGLDDTAGTPGRATGFNSLAINVAAPNVFTFAGTVTATNMGMTGTGTQILTGATSWTGNTNIGGGKLQIGSATTAGLNISTSGTLTFTGGGEGTLAWVLGTGASAGFTASSMGPRQAGGTVNFQVVGGVNGSTNFIKVTSFTPGFIDQGSFFNGADYAFIDAAGFVRAPQYGVDSGFSAADALTAGTHGLVSGNDSVGSTTLNTVKLTSGSSLTISGGSTLNLNNSGILKSGGGSATISGGNILPAFNTELVIRVDQAGDNLTINSVIQDNGTTSGGTLLTKSGAGTLTLGVANTFAGKLNLLAGTVVVANPLALQNTMVSLVNNGGQIQFASGTTTAVFGALTSAVGANGTLTLQDQSADAGQFDCADQRFAHAAAQPRWFLRALMC